MSSAEILARERLAAWQRQWQAITHQPMRDSIVLLLFWLAFRITTSACATLISPLRPLTPGEQAIPLWPLQLPVGAWLERVLLLPWQRWDVHYYLAIVERGYRTDDGTAQFHPLLPWLALPWARLTGSGMLGLLLVSSAATLGLLLAFDRLARLDLSAADSRMATLLLLCSPPAFILFAPYTESLWLLCAVLCLFWARRRSWWLAGLAGGLATLTRQQGIFLLLPLAWELWTASGRNGRQALRMWRAWLSLALIPIGLLIWLVYRALALGDLQANLADPQALIYSLLISPSASKVVPVQAFLPPWQALWLALEKMWREPEISLAIDLILGGAFLVLAALAWPRLTGAYRILVVTMILVSFSYHTGPFYPYMGLPRHLLLAFPVFIGLAPLLRRSVSRLLVLSGGMLGASFLLMLYVLESWTP